MIAQSTIDSPGRALDGSASAGHGEPPALTGDSLMAERRVERSWSRLDVRLLIVVTATALFFNVWGLAHNGLGNEYYTAAARSMASSWHNWFYAALDPGGFISVDKPPVPLWITALSVRAFGTSTWSVLLPSALAGTAAVALLWSTIRCRFGAVAATTAGAVLALSPINVAVNRLNLPEPWLILFLVAAVWSLFRSVGSARWGRWLMLSGAFVGLAFNTKMLAAYIVVPALALAIMAGTERWRAKLTRAALFGATALATSAAWIVAVDVTPASSRPYVGGSTNNTVRDLVFGYNGFGRVEGTAQGGIGRIPSGGPAGGVGSAMSGPGGIFGGTPGPLRMLSEAVGPQIAWLLPLVALGATVALWAHRRHRARRSEVLLWVGWVALYGVVFSYAKGTFHSYYTALMTPGIAALVGIGVASSVALVRRDARWAGAGIAALVATIALQLRLSGHAASFYGWTRWLLLGGAAIATFVALVAVAGRAARPVRRSMLLLAGAIGIASCLVSPVAWATSETANPVLNATLPQAGPRTGTAGTSFGSASWRGDAALAAFLRAHHTNETWDLVVQNAQQASGLIADDGTSVMALGGFMGTDRATNVATIADEVADRAVRYVLVGSSTGGGGAGGLGGGPGGGGPGGGGSGTQIISAVRSSCVALTSATTSDLPAAYSGSLYDCAGHADALRAAGT